MLGPYSSKCVCVYPYTSGDTHTHPGQDFHLRWGLSIRRGQKCKDNCHIIPVNLWLTFGAGIKQKKLPKQNYFLWVRVTEAGLRKEYNSREEANKLEM